MPVQDKTVAVNGYENKGIVDNYTSAPKEFVPKVSYMTRYGIRVYPESPIKCYKMTTFRDDILSKITVDQQQIDEVLGKIQMTEVYDENYWEQVRNLLMEDINKYNSKIRLTEQEKREYIVFMDAIKRIEQLLKK